MTATRCQCCAGSGKIMGGGMITTRNCDHCGGSGKPIVIDYKAAKKTKSYSNAKRRLQDKDSTLTDEKAEEILDKELQKEVI